MCVCSVLSGGSSVESSPRDTPTRGGRVHRKNERGETPLHLACIKGDKKAASSLVQQGADVNATDFAGKCVCVCVRACAHACVLCVRACVCSFIHIVCFTFANFQVGLHFMRLVTMVTVMWLCYCLIAERTSMRWVWAETHPFMTQW